MTDGRICTTAKMEIRVEKNRKRSERRWKKRRQKEIFSQKRILIK